MPGYIKKVLQKYKHETPPRPQHSPYVIAPEKYGKDAQHALYYLDLLLGDWWGLIWGERVMVIFAIFFRGNDIW